MMPLELAAKIVEIDDKIHQLKIMQVYNQYTGTADTIEPIITDYKINKSHIYDTFCQSHTIAKGYIKKISNV